jgi:phosphoglycolate phosphatase-like HAD superfamily hydrolase
VKALALDFDGVISDSVGEVFAVSTGAYYELRPESSLLHRDPDELLRAFRELMPLGNRAEDYCVALAALEQREPLEDQQAYDRFYRLQDPAWLERYHGSFYEQRRHLSEEQPARWRASMRPYPVLPGVLRRHAGRTRYAIATAKDRRSVEIMLREYGIDDLVPGHLLLDKETGKNKAAHLRRIAVLLDLPCSELTFIDDKVNHLDTVAPLGVRCALAAWGYNGPRELELARKRGYLVCTLEDVEERLFGQVSRAGRVGGRRP